jgi:hypothetical protein
MGGTTGTLLASSCQCVVLPCTTLYNQRHADQALWLLCAPGLALIASGLASNGTLLSLDVSDNHVSSVGAIDLAEALHSDKCKVAQLLLHNNRIGMCSTKELLKHRVVFYCHKEHVAWGHGMRLCRYPHRVMQ